MPIINSIKTVAGAFVGGYSCYQSNQNVQCAAGNTAIQHVLDFACHSGAIRIKTEQASMGVNAQVRVLNMTGDDGTNSVDFYGGEALSHGINQNIDFFHFFNSDFAVVNVNVTINVLNATTGITTEVIASA